MSEAADHSEAAPDPQSRRPPARPALTSNLGSPLEVLHQPRPRALTASLGLWVLSCAAGVAVIIHFGVQPNDVLDALRAMVERDDPSRTDSEVADLADWILLFALCLLIVPVALELLLALLMWARRRWARTVLAIVGVLALPLPVAAVTLLDADTLEPPVWVVVVLGVQGALAVAALVTMLLPACSKWFRLRPRYTPRQPVVRGER